jgi:hypothetical protein
VCHILLQDPNFLTLLCQIDEELASQVQSKGCHCGGTLHIANYPRKPRGCPVDARQAYSHRFSFCCAVCRQRTTPESVRFLGRFVYLTAAVILMSARRAGLTSNEQRWCESLGVGRRTLRRWQQWWRERLMQTRFWLAARAQFMPPVDIATLPDSLLDRFGASMNEALLPLMRFMKPLSVRTARVI